MVVFFLAKDLKELQSFHSTSWPWPSSFSDISTYPSQPQTPKGWYILILDAWRQSRSILWNQSRPSVRLSVTKFVKIGSLFFPDIVRSDSWPLYLVTDKARFLKKKKYGGQNLGQMSQNLAQNYFFCHFLKFSLLVFL